MSVKHKYRFYIDDTRVYPVWSDSANLKWESEGEFVFLRLKLNGQFTLQNGVRKDFNLVWAKDLDHEFTFRAEYIVDGVIVDTINGTFFKTDCPFWDVDNERVDVVVQTIDRYEKLMKAFDKQFDLVQTLQPETYKVNYKKEPLIQIAFPYHSVLYNRIGTSTFMQDLPDVYTSVQLEDFGFIHEAIPRVYIPGTADMTPDVSGIYEQTGANIYTRTDGMFAITRNIPAAEWQISDSVGVVYTAIASGPVPGTGSMLDRNPFTPTDQTTFESVVDPGVSFCAAFPIWYHQRILTDSAFVGLGGTVATIPLPQPDIGDIEFDYDNYVDQSALDPLMVTLIPSDAHSINPTKFGKFNEDAQHFANEYFNPNEIYISSRAYPVLMPDWREYAITEAINFSFEDELMEAVSDIELRDAYALADVIKLLLAQIDTSIYFEASAFASKFLFDTTNPISGLPNLTHFITPKSNIIIADYSQPDTGEMITFGNIDELLKAANLYWWIDNQYNFRIEHIHYFKNGRSYTTPFIGIDLTTLVEPRTGKYWGYHTNKFRYTKEKMPEQITFEWMDSSSEYFNGFPIKINSGFVEKGQSQDMRVSKFSSDISLAIAFPDNFAIEGFFVFGCEFVGGFWNVQYENLSPFFFDILVQNGWWSFYYLHDKFWRHYLPAEDVNINNTDVTATTTKRGKEQSLVFPAGLNPDVTRLITSGIGNCEIAEMEINLSTRKCTIKALGDLDFDNPCPTC